MVIPVSKYSSFAATMHPAPSAVASQEAWSNWAENVPAAANMAKKVAAQAAGSVTFDAPCLCVEE